MGRDESLSEFSGIAGRVLAGTISTGSLGAGMAMGLLLVAVGAGLAAAGAHGLVLPFALAVLAAALARFTANGFFGEWSGSLTSSVGGPWTAVATVALRYLALTLVWYVPLAVTGARIIGVPSSGFVQILGGTAVLAALNLAALTVTAPLFLIVAVSADNMADVFSVEHWQRRFAGRRTDLFTVYAVYAGALCMLALLSLPVFTIATAIDGKLAALVGAAAGCLIFGVSVNLLGRLCGFFAGTSAESIGATDPAEELRGTSASPNLPAGSARQAQPAATLAPEVRRAPPAIPVPRPAPPGAAPNRPVLLAAKQRVDEALQGAEQDRAAALARLQALDAEFAAHPLVLQAIVMCALAEGRVEDAVHAAQRAIPLSIDRGQPGQAAEIFREMRKRKVEPTLNPQALLAIGSALIRVDDLATAAKAFSAVISQDRGHTRAIKGLLQVAEEIRKRKHNPEAAAKVYRLILSTCPRSPLTEFARAGLEEAERALGHPRASG